MCFSTFRHHTSDCACHSAVGCAAWLLGLPTVMPWICSLNEGATAAGTTVVHQSVMTLHVVARVDETSVSQQAETRSQLHSCHTAVVRLIHTACASGGEQQLLMGCRAYEVLSFCVSAA